jgi:site-specific DNA-methyltransferase (adenine-specific)
MDWKTPPQIFAELNKEFNFTWDPCPENPGIDGLGLTPWGAVNFVNPPYGRELPKWIKRGYEEFLKGKTIVFLIPARTDTKYFHEIILPYAKEIRFIKGRLKFQGAKNSAPFPSMIVIFKP